MVYRGLFLVVMVFLAGCVQFPGMDDPEPAYRVVAIINEFDFTVAVTVTLKDAHGDTLSARVYTVNDGAETPPASMGPPCTDALTRVHVRVESFGGGLDRSDDFPAACTDEWAMVLLDDRGRLHVGPAGAFLPELPDDWRRGDPWPYTKVTDDRVTPSLTLSKSENSGDTVYTVTRVRDGPVAYGSLLLHSEDCSQVLWTTASGDMVGAGDRITCAGGEHLRIVYEPTNTILYETPANGSKDPPQISFTKSSSGDDTVFTVTKISNGPVAYTDLSISPDGCSFSSASGTDLAAGDKITCTEGDSLRIVHEPTQTVIYDQ